METSAWVTYSCSPGSASRSMSGRSARGSFSQPSVMAAVRRFWGSSSARVASRWSTRSSRRSAACTSGSRLSPPAVARCSMATTAWMATLRSAGSGSYRCGTRWGSASRPASRPSGLHDRPAQQLVVEQLQQGGRGPRVADLAQGVDGRVLQPGLRAEGGHQREHRLGRADLAQAGRGRVPHVDVRVVQGGDQRRHRPALAERAQHHRREVAHLLVGVAQQREQRPHRRRAQLDVDLHGRVAGPRVLVVAQGRLQRGQEDRRREGRQLLGRRLAHRPALVGHGQEQGGHGLGPARGPSSSTARRRRDSSPVRRVSTAAWMSIIAPGRRR